MKTHVVTISQDAAIGEAIDLMDLYQVNGLPVLDDAGQLCGMVTEGDVFKALLPCLREVVEADPIANNLPSNAAADSLERSFDREADPRTLIVKQIMCAVPISILETADVRHSARQMLASGLKRLPVVDDRGKVVGILNRIDVLQALLEGNL